MYDALKAPTPTAKAVPQFLEDFDIGEVWGGKKDNLVKITSFFDICFHCNKLEFLIGTELDWPGEFFPFSFSSRLGFDSTDDCCLNPLQRWGAYCEGGLSCCTFDKPCFEGWDPSPEQKLTCDVHRNVMRIPSIMVAWGKCVPISFPSWCYFRHLSEAWDWQLLLWWRLWRLWRML